MKKNYNKIKILLVDDDEQYANKLKKALEFPDPDISDSYDVNIFTDANKAIECYCLSKHDVLISDVSLKNTPQYIETGHNLWAKLSKLSNIKNLCVIFISAVNIYGADETAEKMGAKFFQKDKNFDHLAYKICIHIEKFKLRLREVLQKKSKEVIVDLGALQINITKNQVLFNDKIIELNPSESRLMMVLAKQFYEGGSGCTISLVDLLNIHTHETLSLETAKRISGKNDDGSFKYSHVGTKPYDALMQCIYKMRKKIGIDKKTGIISDKKYGFKLQHVHISKSKRRAG